MLQKSVIALVVLIIAIAPVRNAWAALDLFAATDKLAQSLSTQLHEKAALLGPLYNDETKLADELTQTILRELHVALARHGVPCRMNPMSDDLLIELRRVDFDFEHAERSHLGALATSEAIVIGSIARWGTDAYVIRLQIHDLRTKELLGGGSEYLEKSSIPQEIARRVFRMDNLPEDVIAGGNAAAYETRAVSGSYGYFPIDDGITYFGGVYENKISNFTSIEVSVGRIKYETHNEYDQWWKGEGTLFIAGVRAYPFYKGRGLRGFFFGAGLCVWNGEEESFDSDGYNKEDGTSAGGFLDFGSKIVFGPSVFLEPHVRIFSVGSENGDTTIAGYFGASLGAMW
jgi:hypothetical protein